MHLPTCIRSYVNMYMYVHMYNAIVCMYMYMYSTCTEHCIQVRYMSTVDNNQETSATINFYNLLLFGLQEDLLQLEVGPKYKSMKGPSTPGTVNQLILEHIQYNTCACTCTSIPYSHSYIYCTCIHVCTKCTFILQVSQATFSVINCTLCVT